MLRSLVVLAVLAAAGCDQPIAGGSVDGGQVYRSACASCHGPAGVPPASMKAQLGVRDLTGAEFRARANRDLVLNQIRNGSKNKLMPSFSGALNDAQMAAVADFVLALPAAPATP